MSRPTLLRRLLFTQVHSVLLYSSLTEAFALRIDSPSSMIMTRGRGGERFATTQTENGCVDDFIAAASATADERAKTTIPTQKKNPINIFGIDHVVLNVDDLEGMTEWYQTVLGCRVAKNNQELQMMHLDAGSSLIDLVDKNGPLGSGTSSEGSSPNMDHLCLGLTDFDAAAIRDHLASHGVPITTELGVRYGKNGNGESLYFKDPEGNRIEIKKSLAISAF